jgi:peptidoglycan/xylan/chitin deacetylase (PgdA/CDA1 family)/lysophospholipase L1-like esterase
MKQLKYILIATILTTVSILLKGQPISKPLVALTFDDGPVAGLTNRLIDFLEKEEIKATFFLVGKKVQNSVDLAKRYEKNGHEIGNHTFNHLRLTDLNEAECRKEVISLQELFENKLNTKPTLFRAPYLKYDSTLFSILAEQQLIPVNATVYAGDPKKGTDPQLVIKKIREKIAPGSIVLMHEREHTLEALKTLIPELKSEGYQFVTVSELIQKTDKKQSASLDEKINFHGCNYISKENGVVSFQRHSEQILTLQTTKSKFSSKKARTTTGVVASFKTSSPTAKLSFRYNTKGDNRGAIFGIFQDGKLTNSASFKKTDGPELTINIKAKNRGEETLYEVAFPNWANVDFMGIELEDGHELLSNPNPQKKIYVAYGNSITHGTGQSATHQTYPFILSRNMNWELYNVAVGGGKTSIPMAEMLRDDFGKIDYMTILIGYNDYNGEGIDTKEYRKRYDNFLSIIREKHKNTKIFCISPTYTTNHTSTKSGIPISDFRKVVSNLVEKYSDKGDENIYLIEGEKISSEKNLRDPVHFSVEGASDFAKQLTIKIQSLLNTKSSKHE